MSRSYWDSVMSLRFHAPQVAAEEDPNENRQPLKPGESPVKPMTQAEEVSHGGMAAWGQPASMG